MANFNGTDLGFIFEMNTIPSPKALQVNAYCGIDGVGVVDLGSRGGRTTVLGAIVAPDAASLATATQGLRALMVSGAKATLVDQEGTSWASVRLAAFEPSGPRLNVAGGGAARRYRAEFFHQF